VMDEEEGMEKEEFWQAGYYESDGTFVYVETRDAVDDDEGDENKG